MKGIQHSHTTKSSDVCSQKLTASSKIEKNTMTAALVMVCAPVAGLRVLYCCRCPRQPECLSPLGHRSLERTVVSTPFQSVPLLTRLKTLFAVFGTGLGKKISHGMSSTRLCPSRRRSISLLRCRRIQPPDGGVPSMQGWTAPSFGSWWRLPPHTSISIVHSRTAAGAYKRRANRRCLCLTPHVRPNSTTTPRPCGHT